MLFLFQLWAFSRALGSLALRTPHGLHAKVWGLAEVRGTCSGRLELHVLSGRRFKHVTPSRPLQTHAEAKRKSEGSCDGRDLECYQCRQTSYLVVEKFFPGTNMPDIATTFDIYNKASLHDLAKIS